MAVDNGLEFAELLFFALHICEINVEVPGKQESDCSGLPAPWRPVLDGLDDNSHNWLLQRLAGKLGLLVNATDSRGKGQRQWRQGDMRIWKQNLTRFAREG